MIPSMAENNAGWVKDRKAVPQQFEIDRGEMHSGHSDGSAKDGLAQASERRIKKARGDLTRFQGGRNA